MLFHKEGSSLLVVLNQFHSTVVRVLILKPKMWFSAGHVKGARSSCSTREGWIECCRPSAPPVLAALSSKTSWFWDWSSWHAGWWSTPGFNPQTPCISWTKPRKSSSRGELHLKSWIQVRRPGSCRENMMGVEMFASMPWLKKTCRLWLRKAGPSKPAGKRCREIPKCLQPCYKGGTGNPASQKCPSAMHLMRFWHPSFTSCMGVMSSVQHWSLCWVAVTRASQQVMTQAPSRASKQAHHHTVHFLIHSPDRSPAESRGWSVCWTWLCSLTGTSFRTWWAVSALQWAPLCWTRHVWRKCYILPVFTVCWTWQRIAWKRCCCLPGLSPK